MRTFRERNRFEFVAALNRRSARAVQFTRLATETSLNPKRLRKIVRA